MSGRHYDFETGTQEAQEVCECDACGEAIYAGDKIWTDGLQRCCHCHMDVHAAEMMEFFLTTAEA